MGNIIKSSFIIIFILVFLISYRLFENGIFWFIASNNDLIIVNCDIFI